MRLALCNEVLADRPFAAQCEYAAALGYDGIELAPFTVADDPPRLTSAQVAHLRRTAGDAGLAITGLHWLLVKPEGLSVTTGDREIRTRTIEVMRRLTDICAELGGRYLVHGSPAQRRVPEGESRAVAEGRARDAFAAAGEAAARAGVVYCIEPLARNETDLLNTVAEAAAMVRGIGLPALRTMIDASAAGQAESTPVPDLIRQWVPTGLIAHVQLNDRNRRAPGQGEDRFGPILAALRDAHYTGDLGIEPFQYVPDRSGCAARAIGYVRGVLEVLDDLVPNRTGPGGLA